MTERSHDWLASLETLGVRLNEVQTRAVLHTDGPLLLLAAPGSGKTTTLIARIGHLIQVLGVQPSRIKALTFSRAAASDMKERYQRFFPEAAPADFSTIHSFAFEVVRDHYRHAGKSFHIIEGDVLEPEELEAAESNAPPLHKKLILRSLYQSAAGARITDDQLDELCTYISYVKNKRIAPADWAGVKCGVPHAERVLREYEAFKRAGREGVRLMDFDDMLTMANDLLRVNPKLLARYQRRYDYILTDESQDTSLVQHSLVEQLAAGHRNLCVVADDDQSIYSWRGAEPAYLLDFRRVYPEAAMLFMEQNYRSVGRIVETANRFIQRNKNRYRKRMFTQNPVGEPIEIRTFADYTDQAVYLLEQIRGCENLSEIAVLYRNNASSLVLMNAFDRAGVPFYMKDTDNRFFKHWVVEDVLNFMRLTYSDRRSDLLEKVHSKLPCYITKPQMAAIRGIANQASVFDNLVRYGGVKDYQVKLLADCKRTFEGLRGRDPLTAIRTIRGRLGYDKTLEKLSELLGFRHEYLMGILNTLEGIAAGLATMEEFAARLKHLETAMRTSKFNKGGNVVTFSTMHSAKGLEFDTVFLIDLIDEVLPSPEDLKGSPEEREARLEEAARLFYVGMTRARKRLELLTYKERDGVKVAESRFVRTVRQLLPKPSGVEQLVHADGFRNYYELVAAASARKAIRHSTFGPGRIVSIDDRTVKIRFEDSRHGVKTFAVETCLERGLLRGLG